MWVFALTYKFWRWRGRHAISPLWIRVLLMLSTVQRILVSATALMAELCAWSVRAAPGQEEAARSWGWEGDLWVCYSRKWAMLPPSFQSSRWPWTSPAFTKEQEGNAYFVSLHRLCGHPHSYTLLSNWTPTSGCTGRNLHTTSLSNSTMWLYGALHLSKWPCQPPLINMRQAWRLWGFQKYHVYFYLPCIVSNRQIGTTLLSLSSTLVQIKAFVYGFWFWVFVLGLVLFLFSFTRS